MASGSSLTTYGIDILEVDAESAYPTTTPGPRVRVAAYAPFLRDHARWSCGSHPISDYMRPNPPASLVGLPGRGSRAPA
jgi:hypothetical protein